MVIYAVIALAIFVAEGKKNSCPWVRTKNEVYYGS